MAKLEAGGAQGLPGWQLLGQVPGLLQAALGLLQAAPGLVQVGDTLMPKPAGLLLPLVLGLLSLAWPKCLEGSEWHPHLQQSN